MGGNTEKKPWTNLQNSYKNWSKEIRSNNFCNRKVGRAVTKWRAIMKNYHFERVTKIISHFDGSNIIFADCISTAVFERRAGRKFILHYKFSLLIEISE